MPTVHNEETNLYKNMLFIHLKKGFTYSKLKVLNPVKLEKHMLFINKKLIEWIDYTS